MPEQDSAVAAAQGVWTQLESLGIEYERLECDPALADTAAFCAHYGVSLADSANVIIVASKKEPYRYAACVVLADSRLDVNRTVRTLMGEKRVSFASAEQTRQLTGQVLGGVTVFGLPEGLPIYIDARVIERERIVVGGGSRSCKLRLRPAELEKLPGAQIITGLAAIRQTGDTGSPGS